MIHYRKRIIKTAYRDGSVFLHSPESEKTIRLNGIARQIWDMLEYPLTLTEIVDALFSEYSADQEEIAGDTLSLLNSLNEKSLLELSHITPSGEDRFRCRYLSLLKRTLTNLIYPEHEMRIRTLKKDRQKKNRLEEQRYLRDIRYLEPNAYEALIEMKKNTGLSNQAPYLYSHTMIGMTALDNLERCAETVFAENIPGDFLEAGICQGGASIFMRALQVTYHQKRRLWAADSFQGLPQPTSEVDLKSGVDFSEQVTPSLAFSLEGVRDNFLRYNLLDEGVVFLPGWFSDTLPNAPVQKLAILRADADLYASIYDIMENLYPKVSPGGFVIIDDYVNFKFCRQAVDEYRLIHGIDEPIHFVNNHEVYWRKQR